jgi:Na+/H+ antiporter NhaD/arsenite permease-like protein
MKPSGEYLSEDPTKLPQRVVNAVQVQLRAGLQGQKLQDLLRESEGLVQSVRDGLRRSDGLPGLGLELVSLAILAIKPTPDTARVGFDGGVNFALLGAVVALVLMSGFWKSSVVFNIAGTEVGLPGLLRDIGLIVVTLVSLRITPAGVHDNNQFSWGPMLEVAKLFAAIFLTIVPVIAMLKAGVDGPFGAVVRAVTNADGTPNPAMYFWATGALSSFLDNAPTYLVFFNTAGGDPATLMTTLAPTLAAISAGAVFMGANSYIGNAPNLMVKAIAEDRGVKMPSFFRYMAWSGAVLIPLFILMTFIWFR